MKDYKTLYEEALERARKSYNKAIEEGWTCDKCVYEEIFPELKESEDEKNIKDLIDELKCSLRAANCQNDACGGGHEKRIALLEWSIAWLEKQGEQKSVELLKDLPKWKKMPNGIQGNGDFNPTYLVRVSNGYYFTTPCLSWDKDSMYIELSELEKLPKEE